MYKVRLNETGELLGETHEPRYITIAKNGCYVQTNYEHARGIAFQSTPYNVVGFENREQLTDEDGNDLPAVVVYEVDDGTVSMEKQEQINQLQEDLSTTDEVAISLYEATLENDEVNAAQDDTLIELYEMIGGN